MSKIPEERDVYFIPPNFLTSGRIFGGAIRIRNAIEAAVLVLITGLPIIKLPLSLTTRIILLCLLPLPLGIFGVIGIEGDALSEFIVNWVRWLKNRRILYRSDVKRTEPIPKAPKATMSHTPPEQLGITIRQPKSKRRKKKKHQ